MVLNTTSGPRPKGDPTGHVVNTSDVLEPPQMTYEDEEPEITHVLNATGWAATFKDGHQEDLLFWCVDDEGAVFGAALSNEGLAELASVEASEDFVRYVKTSDVKETK